jgi:hypothetical protein
LIRRVVTHTKKSLMAPFLSLRRGYRVSRGDRISRLAAKPVGERHAGCTWALCQTVRGVELERGHPVMVAASRSTGSWFLVLTAGLV